MATPRPEQHFTATLGEAAEAVEGSVRGASELQVPLRAVTTDSRDVPDDALFVALVGEHFDGHDFVAKAADAGAAAAMVQRDVGADLPQIQVSDTLEGLGRLARWHRDRFEIPVAAVTGSAGKSTTKEMIAAVFGSRWNVLKTTGNLNNRIGVPLTLFALGPEHEAAVIEAGISLPGEMAHLTDIIRPTIRVVLNAALSHVEFLTDVDRVAAEKARLFDGATASDVLVFNADDERIAAEALRRTIGARLSFGLGDADVRASDIELGGTRGSAFTLLYGEESVRVEIEAVGAHNVRNALAAAACGLAAGLSLEEIAGGLQTGYVPMAARSRTRVVGDDILLIDDTYNSNPASARAALEMLVSLGRTRTIAVLGDMLELGSAGESAHEQVGRAAADLGVTHVITFGPLSKSTARAAEAAGVETVAFDERAACGRHVAGMLTGGDAVLVKGSRGMKMEEVVAAIDEAHGGVDA